MVSAHIRQSREVLCSTEEWRAEVSLTTYRDCTRTAPPYHCSRPLLTGVCVRAYRCCLETLALCRQHGHLDGTQKKSLLLCRWSL